MSHIFWGGKWNDANIVFNNRSLRRHWHKVAVRRRRRRKGPGEEDDVAEFKLPVDEEELAVYEIIIYLELASIFLVGNRVFCSFWLVGCVTNDLTLMVPRDPVTVDAYKYAYKSK